MINAQVSWTSSRCDVLQQPTACLLTQISPFTFLQAAIGAKTRPICTLHSVQMCVRVCVEVRVRVEEMALSSCASGRPLAELSSLAGTGNTAQLQGNHSAGNLRFHLSPIHSGTYLERRGGRCACHEPEGRARLVFWTAGVKSGRASTGHMFGLGQ